MLVSRLESLNNKENMENRTESCEAFFVWFFGDNNKWRLHQLSMIGHLILAGCHHLEKAFGQKQKVWAQVNLMDKES